MHPKTRIRGERSSHEGYEEIYEERERQEYEEAENHIKIGKKFAKTEKRRNIKEPKNPFHK